MTFKPGDLVVFVGKGTYKKSPQVINKPCLGSIYTVRGVTHFSKVGLYLEEIHNPPFRSVEMVYAEPNFWADEFRPVRKPDISVLKQALVSA